MSLRFTVLASGSSGNVSLVETNSCGILVDIGLGPRQIQSRFASLGKNWKMISGVVLTHTHGDHWKDSSLNCLLDHAIPLHCHREHQQLLQKSSRGFQQLEAAGLIRLYESSALIQLGPGLRCFPFPVCHDGGPTFGFRFEGPGDLFEESTVLGYAADLGCWDNETVRWLMNADLLALEFNHDPGLESSSNRSVHLIHRVLGDQGHLSNNQAAELLSAILQSSQPGRLRNLVQLHLSRHCNRHQLAQMAAQPILDQFAPIANLVTAFQDFPTPTLQVGQLPYRQKKRRQPFYYRPRLVRLINQPLLPGIESEF